MRPRCRGSEHLRGLDERDRGIGEVRQHLVQQLRARHEVGIQQDEELPIGEPQRIVDVAGLGVLVGVPPQVLGTQSDDQLTDLIGTPIIEHDRAMQATDGHRRGNRATDHLNVLPVGGDQHIDGRDLLMQMQGPPLRLILEPRLGDPGRVEQQPAGLVEREAPWVVAAGQDGPQGQHRVGDDPRLRGDHQHVGQQVAAVFGRRRNAA